MPLPRFAENLYPKLSDRIHSPGGPSVFDEYLYRYEPGRTIRREGKEGGVFFRIKEGLARTYEPGSGARTQLRPSSFAR